MGLGFNVIRWDSMGFDVRVGGRSVVRWVRVYYLALSSVPAVFCVNEYGDPFSYAGLCMGGLGSVCFLGAILPCGWDIVARLCVFLLCIVLAEILEGDVLGVVVRLRQIRRTKVCAI